MQLHKQNWKKLRSERPCRSCGKDHDTKTCLTKRGKKRDEMESD